MTRKIFLGDEWRPARVQKLSNVEVLSVKGKEKKSDVKGASAISRDHWVINWCADKLRWLVFTPNTQSGNQVLHKYTKVCNKLLVQF